MSAFPKAAIQNVRIGVDLNVCYWPKADIQMLLCGLPRLWEFCGDKSCIVMHSTAIVSMDAS